MRPVAVVSTVGTTGTGAVDPVEAVAEVVAGKDIWHHVDAAWAGSFMICPEFRHHQAGIERADSYVFNPHKLMFTNVDCSVFYVADREPLLEVMNILPPYLRNRATESGEVIDYRDWHLPLGRRFRSLKLWFVLRTYGAAGIRHHMREFVRLAAGLEASLDAHESLEIVAPRHFALVSFRHTGGDDATDRLTERINASGHSYVTASTLEDGTSYIRVSVGQTRTTGFEVNRLAELIAAEATALSG